MRSGVVVMMSYVSVKPVLYAMTEAVANVVKNGTTTRISSSSAIMQTSVGDKLNRITERTRTRADVTKVSTIQNTIRVRCMDATMTMLRKMHPISQPSTYSNVARGMMLIADSTPIRCMCVGISPYENGILPSLATALAYSPALCSGSTPSVQVMSQIMSLCAIKIKDRTMNSIGDVNLSTVVSRESYTAKFAMMLRCSYSCARAGVAFVNASPMITNTNAKKCLSSSLFSEWIASVIIIHAEFGYRMTVISMGATADEAIARASGSYPSMSSDMHLITIMNPAAISRMSVNRYEISNPIAERITSGEAVIDSILGANMRVTPITGFYWNVYPDSVLHQFIKPDSIRRCVELLVDQAPDRLLNDTAVSIENLYTKMSNSDIEAMMSGMGVVETGNQNTYEDASGIGQTSDIHPETVAANASQKLSTFINPFDVMNQDTSAGSNTAVGAIQGSNQNAVNAAGRNWGTSKDGGPPMFGKRSQLGQLLDPSAKGVSSHVIVIDNFINNSNQIMMAFKQKDSEMKEIVRRQTIVIDLLKRVTGVDQSVIEVSMELINSFDEMTESMFEKMEAAMRLIESIPAVIEGDRGIYENETMPVAPMLRRDDGSIVKSYVYSSTARAANMSKTENEGASTSAVPIANSITQKSAINPFTANSETNESQTTNSTTNLIQDGDKTYREIATRALISTIHETEFETGTAPEIVIENLKMYTMTVGNTSTNMFDVMIAMLAERMSLNSGSDLDESEIALLVECLASGSKTDLRQYEDAFATAVMSATEVENFFDILCEELDEETSEESDATTHE